MEVSKGTAEQIQLMVVRDKLTPEQIAQALGMPLGDVLANLAISTKLKGSNAKRGEETLNAISKLRRKAVEVLGDVMDMIDDQPHLALAAAKFTLEVDLGKHDAAVANQSPVNITTINQILVQGNSKYDEVCKEFEGSKKPELINA